MKTENVKNEINELIQLLKNDQAVATHLGISKRWVAYLKTGERSAGILLANVIKKEVTSHKGSPEK